MGIPCSRNTEELIRCGIAALRAWYRELGLPQSMQELGLPADADFAAMAQAACKVYGGGADVPALPGIHPHTAQEAEAVYRAATR